MAEFQMPFQGTSDHLLFQMLTGVVRGYVEAVFFTDCHGDDPELEDATFADLSTESLAQIITDCMELRKAHPDAVAAFVAEFGEERLGHQFWYTRNGHGTGFWESEFEHIPGIESLTDFSRGKSDAWVYRGDDGKVYVD